MKYPQFVEKVTTEAQGNTDLYIPSKNLSFREGGQVFMYTKDTVPVASSGTMNDWAKFQVTGRLDGPNTAWLWKENHCPDTFAVEIMNRLVDIRKEDNFLVRMKNETVRAVLSDQYTIFDNTELIDLTTQAIQTMGIEPEIMRPYVGDDLSAYILFPSVKIAQDPRSDGKGGQLHPAVHISNSERGSGSAKIAAAVFTGFCQNGLIYGWSSEETMAVRHRGISSAVMVSLVANSLANALQMSEEAAKVFVASQDIHIPKPDLSPIVERWAKNYGLTVDSKENWLNAITGETNRNDRANDPRVFDVVNAATWLSQQYEPAYAIQMERMAGDLLAHYNR